MSIHARSALPSSSGCPWGAAFGRFAATVWIGIAVAMVMPPSGARAGTPVISVTAGGVHTCAILINETLKCWGYNGEGQLGMGDTETRGDEPGEMGSALHRVFFPPNGGVKQVALGYSHTCALDGAGQVFCWGFNAHGQAGSGDTNNVGDEPDEVSGAMRPVLSGAKKISLGFYHSCALLMTGAVSCWGANYNGQLGTGDTRNRLGRFSDFATPNLGTGRMVVDLAAGGYSTCVLLDNQQVKCWGYNVAGVLGQGDILERGSHPDQMGDNLPPVSLQFVSPIRGITVGGYHACAFASQEAKCWGWNGFGELGVGDALNRGDHPGEMGAALPRTAGGYYSWQLVAGAFHTCAPSHPFFVATHAMRCWGYNLYGQLGLGDTVNRGAVPGQVDDREPRVSLGGGDEVVGMTAGIYHTCARMPEGTVKCWGRNTEGQLGLGDTENRGDEPGEMGDALPVVDL